MTFTGGGRMRDATLRRYTGAFAAVGGGTWAVTSFFMAASGACQGQACPLEAMTPGLTRSVAGLFVSLSLMLLAAAGVGLVFVVGRQGALGILGAVPGAVGAVTCAAGFACLVFGMGSDDDFDGPYSAVTGIGIITVYAGITLVSCVLLGVRGPSQAIGGCLLTWSLLLAATLNESTPGGALAVASGMCWCGAGALLLLPPRGDAMTEGQARRSIAAPD